MKNRIRIFFAILTVLILYTGLQVGRLMPAASTLLVWTVTILFFWIIIGWQFLYRSKPSAVESPGVLALAWCASIALGVWATFLPLALPFDLFGGLGRGGTLVLALIAAAIAAIGLGEVRRGPIVEEVEVPVAGLPKALEGLRIAQISDLHVGATIREGYVERVVKAVLALEPDLIAVTGDLADGAVESLERVVRPLENLKAPLGVFYVTGNHEYYWDAGAWLKMAAALGFTPLVDENRVVTHNGEKILVGGVADTAASHFIAEHRSDPRRAAASSENTTFKLLLAHRPDSCLEAEPAGFDLQLSGHTHGGQFFPYSLLIRFFHRYYRGLNRHGRMWVYVSPGTGYWGPPHRFAVPSEITLLRLRAT